MSSLSGQPEREETDVLAGTSRLAVEEPRETAAMSGVSVMQLLFCKIRIHSVHAA